MFLCSFKSESVEKTDSTLLEYLSTFAPVHDWLVDKGLQFQNEMFEVLPTAFRYKHQFSTAYVSWLNGTFDFLQKQVSRVMRAHRAEIHIPESDCPNVVSSIRNVINNVPSCFPENRAPD